MSDFESTLEKTRLDIQRIQSQIQNLVNSLTANHDLFELDLVPIVTNSNDQGNQSKIRKLSSSSSSSAPGFKSNKKQDPFFLSQSFHFDPEELEEESEEKSVELEALRHSHKRIRPIDFEIVEPKSSTFCLPVRDTWVWGTTIRNVSREALPFPQLLISHFGKKGSASGRLGLGHGFLFEFSVRPITSQTGGLHQNQSGEAGILLDIPYQESYQNSIEQQTNPQAPGLSCWVKKDGPLLQPGSKAFVTATFHDPVHLYGSDYKCTQHASLFSASGKFQWTQKLSLSVKKASCLSIQDPKYEQFLPQILSGMSPYSHLFTLERLMCQTGDKIPATSLKRFLIYLKFKSVESVADSSGTLETFINIDMSSLLHGIQIQIERGVSRAASDSSSSSVRVLVCSTTKAQFKCFLGLVNVWISSENKSGLPGIRLLRPHLGTSPRRMLLEFLLGEIEIMSHLVLLGSRSRAQGTGRKRRKLRLGTDQSLNWTRRFMGALIYTDSSFYDIFQNEW